MRKIAALALMALLLTMVVFASAQQGEKMKMADPAEELAKSIATGKELFNDKSLGTSGKTCNSCHMMGGTKGAKMGEMTIKPFDDLGSKYPNYFMMGKKVMTLSQVVNFCVVKPLKGEALKWDDQKLTDLTAYVASVKVTKKD